MTGPSSARRRGRPPASSAASHVAIMDAVYALLQEKSVRDLSMDEIAKRAGVGKPTLYKWWPSKAELVMAMFHERIARRRETSGVKTAEEFIRSGVRRLIRELNGLFGKVIGELIAEGQSEPEILRDLREHHMLPRRLATIAEIERGKASGELSPDIDPELLIDAIFGALYFQFLLRMAPLTERHGQELVDQVLRGVRARGADPR
ncbi:MAG TPA: TetR/AcrR family transcriptional regulator [Polyangiaceae bacterium]|nr:TetR/AcrR family transcriptional regulator [Polyangiaceae bacterium]